jgi:hypothetical protein
MTWVWALCGRIQELEPEGPWHHSARKSSTEGQQMKKANVRWSIYICMPYVVYKNIFQRLRYHQWYQPAIFPNPHCPSSHVGQSPLSSAA